jgi:hypothetical protein
MNGNDMCIRAIFRPTFTDVNLGVVLVHSPDGMSSDGMSANSTWTISATLWMRHQIPGVARVMQYSKRFVNDVWFETGSLRGEAHVVTAPKYFMVQSAGLNEWNI